jgi:hypothetical protein
MAELHPSYLELDRHALGAAAQATTAGHVAECERCRAYLESMPSTEGMPAWLPAARSPLRVQRTRPLRVQSTRPQRTRRWALATSCLAAAAALFLVWLRARPEPSYDGVKGAPGVGVYVLRAGQVQLWDGAPLEAGDRIRLEVAPEQFRRVSVFSLAQAERPRGLYAGPVTPGVRQVLPKAWQVDAAPTPEQLAVFFSDMEISAQAAEVLLSARDPRSVWLVRLSLPKRGDAGTSP